MQTTQWLSWDTNLTVHIRNSLLNSNRYFNGACQNLGFFCAELGPRSLKKGYGFIQAKYQFLKASDRQVYAHVIDRTDFHSEWLKYFVFVNVRCGVGFTLALL